MNILFTNSAKQYGGNERWLCTTANALSELGHKIFFAGRNQLLHDKLNKEIQIFNMPFKHELDKKTSSEIIKVINEKNINLLFPTKRKENYLLGKIGKRLNLPVVFRLGIYRHIKKIDLPQRFVYRQMPDKIIVNAKAIKDYLVEDKVADSSKIEVLYNGYTFNDEVSPYPIHKSEGKLLIATAGRLAAQKGYDLLLEAVNILKTKRQDFEIVIAGDGGARGVYEQYIKENGLENHVTLLGHIDNVRGLFDRADFVIIPSRSEGIPNTLFEAWSLRKPVLAANSSGIPEAINHNENGYLFELSPNEIAKAIDEAITSQEKFGDFGLAGYDTLVEKFTLDKMLTKLLQIFEELIESK